MSIYVDTVEFDLRVEHDEVEIITGVWIKPVKLDAPVEPKHKIPVLIKIYHADWQIINLPQEISQHYPVVIHKKPRTVLYGKFSSSSKLLSITVAARHKIPVNKKKLMLSIISPNIMPVVRKSRRMISHPFSYSIEVGRDIYQSIQTGKNNRGKRHSFSDLSDENSKKYRIQFSILASLFLLMPVIFYLITLGFNEHFNGYTCFIMLLALIPLYMRYQVKYKQNISIPRYMLKLLTGRGL